MLALAIAPILPLLMSLIMRNSLGSPVHLGGPGSARYLALSSVLSIVTAAAVSIPGVLLTWRGHQFRALLAFVAWLLVVPYLSVRLGFMVA